MPAKKKATKRPTPKQAAKAPRKRSAAPKSAAPSLSDALAQAAWEEADRALAEALIECDALAGAASKKQRDNAMTLLTQALARAARKRGLSRIGELGDAEKYDPQRHELAGVVAKMPRKIRIAARGVARGAEVVLRPRVAPIVRKARKKSGR